MPSQLGKVLSTYKFSNFSNASIHLSLFLLHALSREINQEIPHLVPGNLFIMFWNLLNLSRPFCSRFSKAISLCISSAISFVIAASSLFFFHAIDLSCFWIYLGVSFGTFYTLLTLVNFTFPLHLCLFNWA